MSRGIGEFDLIQEQIPEWLAVGIALATQLGDVWFLVLVLTVLYWVDTPDRDDIAVVAGVTLAGMGLYKGLKEVFGFPRPEEPLLDPALLPWLVEPLYEATATAGGYGFPSGHAVNTTVVYFGLASVLSLGTKRLRFGVAAALVSLVCFTRVALGVHYVVDVVVGVAVGLTLLVGARVLLHREFADRATIAFALGIGLSAFFLVAGEWTTDAVYLLAGSLGAFSGWQLVMLGRGLVGVPSVTSALRPVLFRGGAAAVASGPLVAALDDGPLLSLYTTAGIVGLVTAVVVVLPVVRHSDHARALYARVRHPRSE
ncbi:phosphatase PAP2 family protein [Natronorubrum sp. JWXQ-INN-674]|uniref:Phosphatase PAP2 family protein n=1 Tax=Natronorubrum halalkaliphilum TaxID=2691917 RepID=A0A6B0VS52_9EURY|nr:phosphatase PAP2 family protein [Natronorubrum halalkaliphilum]MXV64195.1 phosphatase PAP2 family protein [Natronorubrum halalkaliphilum]